MDNEELTRLFAAAGRRFGFIDVKAAFVAFPDFRIRWTRNYKWAVFEITDYISDAPSEVVSGIAEVIFAKICGDEACYSESICRWLSAPDFVARRQPVFVRRFPGFRKDPRGKVKDLAASYERLIAMGLVERDPELVIGWAPAKTSRCIGKSSVVLKVVVMSDILDDEVVTDDLFDYCLYTQLAHVAMGFNPEIGRRGVLYDALLSKHPRRAEMDSELRRLNVHFC